MTQVHHHELSGVIEFTPPKSGDHRGFFSEVFKQSVLDAEGVEVRWVQDNQSFSAQPGTVRGLHLQAPPFAQAKLIRVLRGAIFDVAVDIRRGSPTYGQWVGVELSAEKWNQLLVPVGYAHGFMTLVPDCEILYKVSARYAPDEEMAIRWDDPDLAIAWPDIGVEPVLSGKDAVAPSFAAFNTPFFYQG